MAVKYQMQFVNSENITCIVKFDVSGYSGPVINIAGGTRPFILREFNTDLDYYKPIRPMLAEMEILASDGLDIDDFLEKTTITFYYGGDSSTYFYWRGELIQDDFQETWIDSAHLFTLRATDNFDKEKEYPYRNGLVSFWDALGYGYDSGSISFTESRIINGLFYFGMDDFTTGNYIALSQAYIDQMTFQSSPTAQEKAYEVIKKINRAWLQTMFQYRGEWWFFRMEEPLNNPTTFKGVVWTPLAPGGNSAIDTRWDYNIGVDETIKPIQPQALKTINRKTKIDKINIKYEFPPEVVCNQNFQRGAYIQTVNISASVKAFEYEVDCFTLIDWTSSFTFPGSAIGGTSYVFRRREYLTNGDPTDDTGVIIQSTANKNLVAKSDPIRVQKDQRITFKVDTKFATDRTGQDGVAYILLETDTSNYYFLDDDGSWNAVTSGPPFVGVVGLVIRWLVQEDARQYKTYTLRRPIEDSNGNTTYAENSALIPANGNIYIYLNNNTEDIQFYTNIEFEAKFDDVNKRAVGNYSQYTQTNDLRTFEDEIFFDDLRNVQYQGAIYEDTSYTLTEADKWYRYQWEPESLGFKQANAIGQYLLHRRYRMKLDGKFFGLNGTTNTIGLHHTFIFVDDLPTKQFMILNLNEIDFNAATWSATLIETFDTDIDDSDPADYDEYKTAFIY